MKVSRWGLLGFLLLVPLLWAAEPWKDKPYTEWTAKEVQRLFEDSPWARPVPTAFAGTETVAVMSGESPETGTPVARSDKVKSFVIVQWASSRTVREGIVRARQLQGTHSQDDAAKFLSAAPPDYVIVVFGPDVQKLDKVDEVALRQSTYLQIKQTNRKMPAASLNIVRQGLNLSAVEFHFPRQMDWGPAIRAEDKKVTFSCPFAGERLSATFDLRKMVRDGQPDL